MLILQFNVCQFCGNRVGVNHFKLNFRISVPTVSNFKTFSPQSFFEHARSSFSLDILSFHGESMLAKSDIPTTESKIPNLLRPSHCEF